MLQESRIRAGRARLTTLAALAALALAACAGPVAPTLPVSPSPAAHSVAPPPSPAPSFSALPSSPTASPAPSTAATASGLPRAASLPAHVFAPYLEMYSGDRVATVSGASGARHFTLAFLETTSTSSCQLGWNGATGFEDAQSVQLLDDVAALRASGGDIIPSFGGYSADNTGREIGDSCADPGAIADAYESVVSMLGVTRLDMDIEDESLNRPDGIDRRNKALRILQDRYAAAGTPIQISYTLPTGTAGLDDGGLAVLRSAVENGTQVDVVNIMVFDYYDGTTTDMAAAAISAATGLHGQLAGLYPDRSDAALWGMIGITLMPGIDDYPQKTEVTTIGHARKVLAFATDHGLASLSMWAVERDHGSCPGEAGNDGCSGVAQADWAFTRLLDDFTGP